MRLPAHLNAALAIPVLLAAVFAAASSAQLRDPADPEPAAAERPPEAVQQPETPKLPSIKDGVKEHELVNNNMRKAEQTFFKLWRKDDSLLAELSIESLGKPWLLSSTFSAGPYLTGFQLGSTLVEWRRRDRELQLVEPETRYTASAGGANADNVKRTYTDRYILSVPILAEDPEQAVLFDLSAMLTQNSVTLVGQIGEIQPQTARVTVAKAFARNVEVAFSAAHSFWLFSGSLVTLHYSLSSLEPQPTFQAREADQRVGYWVHARRDFSQRDPLRDDMQRIIERWDLRKARPELKTSPPVKPIVFYIEKSVPLEYRLAVRRGVEAWNEAFMAIGLANAIEVRQQTDTQYADIDPEDVRYNFVRWITTGGGFAIALHRADPRTGEILDADILIDDSWIKVWVNEFPLMARDAWNQRLRAFAVQNPEREQLEEFDEQARGRGILPLPHVQPGDNPDASALPEHLRRALAEQALFDGASGALARGSRRELRCNYARRLAHSMSLAALQVTLADTPASDAEPMLDGVPERLIAENLVALTAHEVGHVLGLRHNFVASSWRPLSDYDAYNDPSQEPPVASVMDYSGSFVAPPGQKQGLYNMMRVGPYDRWAIACGYQEFKEEKDLDALLSRSVEPAHRFGTDEDVYSPDATALPYDVGSDPVAGRKRQFDRIDRARAQLLTRLAKDGENYSAVNSAFLWLWWDEFLSLWDCTGWIGASYLSRDHRTEGARSPLENVEPERQRAMLQFLIDRAFAPQSFQFEKDLLDHLQVEKWYYSNMWSWPAWGGGDTNVHGMVNTLQWILLFDIFNFATPRLLNQELRTSTDVDALTLPELHSRLTDAIWSEFSEAPPSRFDPSPTNVRSVVSALRRNLQREHAEQLISLGVRYASFSPLRRQPQLIAMHQLRRIREALTRWNNVAGLDDYTRIHIDELAILIDARLEAQVMRAP